MSHHNLVAREEDQYQGLRFSFADMEMEIENMRRLAKQFLERGSYERIIPEWKDQLSAFRSQGSGALTIWRIQEETPIQTRESIGEYESGGRKGKHNIFGRISGSWEIRLPTVTGKKRRQIPATFILLGLASTKISIWANQDEGDPLELARWSIDIGDASSPGCHFHTQIDLDDDNHKFPKSLPVPRFPTLLHTPMDALDFLLYFARHEMKVFIESLRVECLIWSAAAPTPLSLRKSPCRSQSAAEERNLYGRRTPNMVLHLWKNSHFGPRAV